MFVPNFSSSVGRLNPSGVHFMVALAKMCLDAGTINSGVQTRCSPRPGSYGRGHCLTTLDAIPDSPEVTHAVGVTARKSCS